ncbi:hypothetical protein F4781DRAFT_429471 [Annulohypoxylon bovei var. microspora]|nr:hypothetical protein F4781DRAFT_429471 [Annulohypoxylon bovei var. microspora]
MADLEQSPTPAKSEPHVEPSSLPAKSRTECENCHEQFKSRSKLMKHVYSKECLESTGKPSTKLSTNQEIETLKAEVAMLRDEVATLRNELEKAHSDHHDELEKFRSEQRKKQIEFHVMMAGEAKGSEYADELAAKYSDELARINKP